MSNGSIVNLFMRKEYWGGKYFYWPFVVITTHWKVGNNREYSCSNKYWEWVECFTTHNKPYKQWSYIRWPTRHLHRQGIKTFMEEDNPVEKPKRQVRKLPFSIKYKLKFGGQTSTDTVNLTNNEVISLEASECCLLTTLF